MKIKILESSIQVGFTRPLISGVSRLLLTLKQKIKYVVLYV